LLANKYFATVRKEKSLVNNIMLLGILITLFITFGGLEYLTQRFSYGVSSDSSSSVKVANLAYFFTQDSLSLLFGNGLEKLPSNCAGCNHLKSNGLAFYLLYSFGIIGSLLFFITLIIANLRKPSLIIFTIFLLLMRYTPIYPIFWIAFSFIVYRGLNDKNSIPST
jgi:hypothetical protein